MLFHCLASIIEKSIDFFVVSVYINAEMIEKSDENHKIFPIIKIGYLLCIFNLKG